MASYEEFELERRGSMVTIASTVATDYLRQNTSRNNSLEDVLNAQPSNVKIDGSKAIQVGDIIYNFYTPPAYEEFNFDAKAIESGNLPKKASIKATTNAIKKPDGKLRRKLFSRCKQKPTKKQLMIFLAVLMACIGSLICSVIYIPKSGRSTIMDSTTTPQILSTETFSTESTADSSERPNSTVTASTSTTKTTTSVSTTPKIPIDFKLIRRDDWEANPPTGEIKRLVGPIKRIIIDHTGDESSSCSTEDECKERVKKIQLSYPDLMDIPFNFLIGDGIVIEGRGFDYEGEHTSNPNGSSYNNIGICVAFIGIFSNKTISGLQKKIFDDFLEFFIDNGLIDMNYLLFFHDQLAAPVKYPADELGDTISRWVGFYSVSKIYRRDEWKASNRLNPILELPSPQDQLALTQIGQKRCTTLAECGEILRKLQTISQSNKLSDINAAFLIGEGMVFEARGFDVISAAVDDSKLVMAFIGNFSIFGAKKETIEAAQRFFDDAEALGKLTKNYKVRVKQNSSFGKAMMATIKQLKNYSPD